MASYYVDLGLGTDGHAGTEIDPFSQNDFITATWSVTGIFYLKGIGPWWPVSPNNEAVFRNDTLTSWPGTNLPWVLRSNAEHLVTYGANTIIENGIFHTEGYELWLLANPASISYTFRNCRFDCFHLANFASGGTVYNYYGCLLNNHRSQFRVGSVTTMVDCAVTDDFWIEWDGAATVNTHRCAFKLSQVELEAGGDYHPAPEIITYDNCQFSWPAPTLPDYTDTSRSSYDAAALYSGVSTPPEPGTPPYTDYVIDPWGTVRNGIGFGAFSGVVPHTEMTYLVPAPSRNGHLVRSQVNFPALMTHLAGDPTYFGTETQIRRVDVHYYDPNMRERKEIVHMGYPDMHGFVAWTPNASAGTWTKQKIIVYDTENARHYIERSEIGSGEDVVF